VSHRPADTRATFVVDDLASTDPFTPRGIKIRGFATLEESGGSLRIRIRPTTTWSWGINKDAPTHFAGADKRQIPSQ
jgi:pyridoxamine 5'-phosphate oxidase family protein